MVERVCRVKNINIIIVGKEEEEKEKQLFLGV